MGIDRGNILRYDQAARNWNEALPLGNGSLGAMVFGGVEEERLQLNQDTLWSGHPRFRFNPKSPGALPGIRAALARRDYAEADRLSHDLMGAFTESYLPMADLRLRFMHGNIAAAYSRSLDLGSAQAEARYRIGGAEYRREGFISAPDQILAYRIHAAVPGSLSFSARLDSKLTYSTSADAGAGAGQYVLRGRCPDHVVPSYWPSDAPMEYGDPLASKAMRFEVRLGATAQGGTIRFDQDGVHVERADSATIILAAATGFRGWDAMPDNDSAKMSGETAIRIRAAQAKGYQALMEEHRADHRRYYSRVELKLGPSTDRAIDAAVGVAAETLSTDRRIAEYGAKDHGLVELLFNYGRYLMIAASRPGTQPMNLQGIWNDETRAPWSSNYTININTQMNYWPAESCNLSECHLPLLDFLTNLASSGERTARDALGCRGWTAAHNTDIWAHSTMVGDFGKGHCQWAVWPMGGIWLSAHAWEHWQFTQDKKFLKDTAWPLLKGAALFALDWLVEDGAGRLVTAPSTSPENKFKTPSGEFFAVSRGSTMDMTLIRELFWSCEQAASILDVEPELRVELRAKRERLLGFKIGKHGQLQEWDEDFEEQEIHHRHVSHLYGLFPGNQIDPEKTKELASAARTTLERRGDAGTGWSLAWKINLWARLMDGERALSLIGRLLTLVRNDGTDYHGKGGVYANLFDAHPPFQIDGNFGAVSGIAEMLLQSHRDEVHLLPALPDDWKEGSVAGLRARGGFTVDIAWRPADSAVQATITADRSGPCTVRYGEVRKELRLEKGRPEKFSI